MTVPPEAAIELVRTIRADDQLDQPHVVSNRALRQRIIAAHTQDVAASYGLAVNDLAIATAHMLEEAWVGHYPGDSLAP